MEETFNDTCQYNKCDYPADYTCDDCAQNECDMVYERIKEEGA